MQPNQAETAEKPPTENGIGYVLGPGIITGAADDDPSGIATYASVGAQFGYSMLWTALLMYPFVTCVEYICAKIALV